MTTAVRTVLDERMRLPEFYTSSEVMRILGISRITLHRLRKQGKLIGITINRQSRFSKEEIDLFIERSKKEVCNGE